MPKVSIIVPVYNVEKYLDKCLESIISQSCKSIEIIIVNDGSNDDSKNIAESYAKKDERIKVINKQNGGLSSARNSGLGVADGEYIAFIDSDDWIESDMIEVMYRTAMENDADVVVCNFRIVEEATSSVLKENHFKFNDEVNEITDRNRADYIINSRHGDNVCNKLYKHSIIKQYKIRFEKNSEIYSEDLLFNLYYLCHINKVCIINRAFYNRLIRKGSITQSVKKELIKKYTELVNRFQNYATKNQKQELAKQLIPGLFSTLIAVSSAHYFKKGILFPELKSAIDEKNFQYYCSYSVKHNIRIKGKWYANIYKKIFLKIIMITYFFISLANSMLFCQIKSKSR